MESDDFTEHYIIRLLIASELVLLPWDRPRHPLVQAHLRSHSSECNRQLDAYHFLLAL